MPAPLSEVPGSQDMEDVPFTAGDSSGHVGEPEMVESG